MKKYELLYIIPPKYTENEIKAKMAEVAKLVSEHGTIIRQDNWGKRHLAYKIKTFNHGYYELIVFEAETNKIALISKELRLMSEILRFQIVLSPKPKPEQKKLAAVQVKKEEQPVANVVDILSKPVEPVITPDAAKDLPAEITEPTIEPIVENIQEEEIATQQIKETQEEVKEKVIEIQPEEPIKSEEEEPQPESSDETKKDDTKKEEPKSDEIDLEDLDKKLDKILTDAM